MDIVDVPFETLTDGERALVNIAGVAQSAREAADPDAKRRAYTLFPTKPRDLSTVTQGDIDRFLDLLRIGHNATSAARTLNIKPGSMRTLYERDPLFVRDWEDALAEAREMREYAIVGRAVDGVREPIYQGGVLVGTKRRYADTIALRVLEADNPAKYRPASSVEMSGPDGGPIQTDDRATREMTRMLEILAARREAAQHQTIEGEVIK